MNSKNNGKIGRKRKTSKTQNTSSEKPGKQNCAQKGKHVNDNIGQGMNRMNNNSVNPVNTSVPIYNSPVVQGGGNFHQYHNTSNFNSGSPMAGFYNSSYTPQGPTPQPVFSSTICQSTDTMKLDNLIDKVEQMYQKFSILDSLSDKISKFQSTMNTLVSNVENVTKRVAEVEHSIEFLSSQYESSRKENDGLKIDIADIKANNNDIKGNITLLANELDDLRERHLDLQTRSMRENLIFSGIPETSKNEESEETGIIIKHFMTNELKLTNPVDFVRAHRFGKADKNPRPIVCRFKTYSDRELVRKSATALKGTKYGISEQFPKEIIDRRKVLWPYYKEAKNQNRKAYFKRDRLFIEGKEFHIDEGNIDTMDTSRERFEQQGARPKQITRKRPQTVNSDTRKR